MLSRHVNTPITTSAGRLFDAMAALIGLSQHVTFEGQAAMALEFVADADVKDAYPIVLTTHATVPPLPSSPLVLDWRPLVEAALEELRRDVPLGTIAARFHNALVEAILTVVRTVGESQVALTGGCFQNRLLTERVTQRLREMGCTVLLHRHVPPNDGGISLGQVVVAAAQFMGRNPLLYTEITTCASASLAK
jgi:hydrogenase maturation protein HypF